MKCFHLSDAGRLVALFLFLAIVANGVAQIVVGPTGSAMQIFDSIPSAALWSTKSVPGAGPDPESDAGVDAYASSSTNPASTISAQVASAVGDPPGNFSTAQWTSSGYLCTRPTGNALTFLMATLTNGVNGPINSFHVRYDYSQRLSTLQVTDEAVKGHRVYYSLSGAVGGWAALGDFGNSFTTNVTQAIDIPIDLTAQPWTNGLLYLLFADDNSNVNSDGANAIDNFRITNVASLTIPVINSQPVDTSVTPGGSASFSVSALGAAPLFYQWQKNSNNITGATSQSYAITGAQNTDVGFYSVMVSNSYGSVTSAVATLTVGCAQAVNIVTPPHSQALITGGTISLTAAATGTLPLSYLWQREGMPLAGATNLNFTKSGALTNDSGFYSLVVSNCAGAVTSAVAYVAVGGPPYVLFGLTNQFWKYEQSGANLGTAWKEIAYDDSAWPSGRGVLARETDNALTISLTNTVLSLTGTNGTATITYYFRTHFTLTNDPTTVSLVTSNLIDDGAVFYLNGTEFQRVNMPSGAVTSTTVAVNNATEGVFTTTPIPYSLVVTGDNVLAVEVHQVSQGSSDIVFGLALFVTPLAPGAPTFATQPADAGVFAGGNVVFTGSASSLEAPRLQWFKAGTPLAGETNATLLRSNVQPSDTGEYFLLATNSFGATTSRVAYLSMAGVPEKLRLIEFTDTWRYDASGMTLASAWRSPVLNDTSWASGTSVLSLRMRTDLPEPVGSLLPAEPDTDFSTVYYFRRHFTVPAGITNLYLMSSNLLVDAAVFYVNGVEAGRVRITVNGNTTTTFPSPSKGRAYDVLALSAPNLAPGDNVLAVEVHQTSFVPLDAIFGLNLQGFAAMRRPPSVTSPPATQSKLEGQPATFEARVFGSVPMSYQWFRNGAALADATNSVLSLAEAHPSKAGNYQFIATNAFGAVTSTVATLTASADVLAPAVVSAFTTNGLGGVAVVFSEPVTASSATNVANYSLPGVTILSAQLIAPNVVFLTTAGVDPQFEHTLTVSGIFDHADVPNQITPASPTRVQPTRVAVATGLLQLQTVFIILMENQSWPAIKGSTNLPYLNSLLPRASYCDNYFPHNNSHPSEPNYLWLEAGTDFGYDDDAGPGTDRAATTNHLSTQLFQAGIEWRGYMEDMADGSVGVTNGPAYLARHNPFAFFDDVTTNYGYCTNHVRPYAEFAADLAAGRIGRYNFITPNYTNDMHTQAPGSTSAARQGDDWLARELPRILTSSAFSNNGAIFITWDENDYSDDNNIGMIVFSPQAKGGGYVSPVFYDHSSTLRTMQEVFQVRPYLGDALLAHPLNDLFKDLSLRVSPSNGVAGVWLDNALPGRTNYVQVSTDLAHWITLGTNTTTTSIFVPDSGAPAGNSRFYRAMETP